MSIFGVQFANQLGWYAFISLIILILLYLIRPKPRETNIPSLMFFIKTSGVTKQNSFLRTFINNILFILQFLALSSLAFALTYPYINVPKTSFQQDAVIVLDISASMQTHSEGGVRFDKAIAAAKEKLGQKTTIILASNLPIVALEKGSKDQALKILSSISARDTSTNIGDAILLAGNELGNKGTIVVISDMKQTDGLEIEAAMKAMTARGLDVELINVGSKADNIGIVDVKVTKRQITASVKNYEDSPRTITLVLHGDKDVQAKKTVLPNSIEVFTFETPAGNSELTIEDKDDFEADNHAFIVGPATKKIKVLVVTNLAKSNIQTALSSSPDIELKTAVPPVIPSLDYDVVVMDGFSKELLLPGFFSDLSKRVSKGGNVIIAAQDGLDKTSFDLMPVKLRKIIQNESETSVAIDNQYTTGIEFGRTSKYYDAQPDGGIALVSAANDVPLIALRQEGSGSVVYYGIFDSASDFKSSVSYPIFWNKMVNTLYSQQDLSELNTKTDKILPLQKQTVETPYGPLETSKLFFDKAGIYKIGGQSYAANILNEKESDVSADGKSTIATATDSAKTKELVRRDYVEFLVMAALMFMIVELIMAKFRGDL